MSAHHRFVRRRGTHLVHPGMLVAIVMSASLSAVPTISAAAPVPTPHSVRGALPVPTVPPVPAVPSVPTVPPVPTVPTPVTGPTPTASTTPSTTTASPTGTTPTGSTPAGSTPAGTNPTGTTATSGATTNTSTSPRRQRSAPPLSSYPQDLQHILATIRYHESRGDYAIAPNAGNASGAYQFIESTWNSYGGYQHAYQAPPTVQDERAAADVRKFLAQWNGDVTMVPVMWYYPAASRRPELMDTVPVPSAGNVLTIRQYQTRWLEKWSEISGEPIPPHPGPPGVGPAPGTRATAPPGTPTWPDGTPLGAGATSSGGTAPTASGPTPAQQLATSGAPPSPWERSDRHRLAISFPVLGPSRVAAPLCDDAGEGSRIDPVEAEASAAAGLCAEHRPGIVFGVKLQPVLAAATGVVTSVDHDPLAVTITDVYGRDYTYTGFNDDNPGTDDGAAPPHLRLTPLAEVGTSVWAGQVIGFMGDTAPLPDGLRREVPTDPSTPRAPSSTAPHIRLEISDLNGAPLDAYGPTIDALYYELCHTGTGPWASPPSGEELSPVVVETTDDDPSVDSQWEITSTGQVRASGWAAMIYPSDGCGWIAQGTFGPGAGGDDAPEHWGGAVRLPIRVLIELGGRTLGGNTPIAPLPPVVRGL